MKAKVLKRLIALVMSALLMLGASVSAFATEVPVDVSANPVETVDVDSNSIAADTVSSTYYGTCEPFSTLTIKTTLNSYIGFYKTLYISVSATESDYPPSGYAIVQIFKPNGDVLDEFVAYPDVEDYSGEFFLPSSGTYTIKVHSYVGENLFCAAAWDN